LCVVYPCIASAQADDPWADAVLEYSPIDPPAGFDDSSKALGEPNGGNMSAPNNDDVVSLGSQGGTMTLMFDTAVTDDAENPMGLDCIVYSNAFWVAGNEQRKFQEPALIEISEDANGNGLADDAWYRIPGSRSLGLAPAIAEPAGIDNEPPNDVTLLTGNIRNPNSTDGDGGNDAIEFNWGYAELTPTVQKYLDNYARPDDPLAVGLTEGSGGGDAFDIAWAVDSVGASAPISQFHFIRLTSFIDRQLGVLGPASPEIAAVADVAPNVDTDNDGILDEYESRVAGTDPARRESTVLPLEIPAIEGGSPAGTELGITQDDLGTILRLISAGERSNPTRAFCVSVDILAPEDTGAALPDPSLIKSTVLREIVSSVGDFTAAQIEAAQITIAYEDDDLIGFNEDTIEPYRLDGASYTQDGISQVASNAGSNIITFHSRYPGVFILAAYDENFEPADPTNQGPTAVPPGMPLGGVTGLALLIIAVASGGALSIRRSLR
jgi:hypothetical protein